VRHTGEQRAHVGELVALDARITLAGQLLLDPPALGHVPGLPEPPPDRVVEHVPSDGLENAHEPSL
jgi:hypothetical protein